MRSTLRVFLAVTLGLIASVAIADQYGVSAGGIATGILDGLIVNADVNAAANITATKLGTGAVSNTELNLLDGKTTLVDTDDAVATAITGTGALGAGSIATGFGAIDNGADDITTTGTVAAGAVTANGTVTHNAVATDVACGAGETWTNACTNATFSTGKVTAPTLATTVTEFIVGIDRVGSSIANISMPTYSVQAYTVKSLVCYATTTGGTGSGTTTFTDDAGNTCICTHTCPVLVSRSNVFTCANGAGTGCSVAAGVARRGVNVSSCTTSTPTVQGCFATATLN